MRLRRAGSAVDGHQLRRVRLFAEQFYAEARELERTAAGTAAGKAGLVATYARYARTEIRNLARSYGATIKEEDGT